MIRQSLVCFVFLFLALTAITFAQDEDFQAKVNYKVDRMKQELNLTYAQADAIKPIIKEYMIKRGTLLEDVAGQGIVDHTEVKTSLKIIKDTEYQQLAKVLTEDQMKKWVNKETMRESLNPDGGESTIDDGPSLTAEGANFKF